MHTPKLIVIGGPTASGKSSLALLLAEHLGKQGRPAEILCADSITVYRGFDIGAAKPTRAEREKVPHHLLDLAGPDEEFTAGDFVSHAAPLVESMLARNITPILAGGTGFYLRALLRGMAMPGEDEAKSKEVKSRLEERGKAEGFEALHRELIRKDPGSAATVHPNDHYRIVRALQAMELQGKPWSALNAQARASPPRFSNKFFRLKMEKEELKIRIEQRSHQMLEQGLIEEVKNLLAAGAAPDSKPMQSVGYKETVLYLSGALSEQELPAAITQSTLKLAKQQATWFKGEELAEWLEPPYFENLLGRL